MPEIQIKLSAIWIVVMLIYLLGDVLRIYSGDMVKMQVELSATRSQKG
jgi:hypothetical protein